VHPCPSIDCQEEALGSPTGLGPGFSQAHPPTRLSRRSGLPLSLDSSFLAKFVAARNPPATTVVALDFHINTRGCCALCLQDSTTSTLAQRWPWKVRLCLHRTATSCQLFLLTPSSPCHPTLHIPNLHDFNHCTSPALLQDIC